MAWKDQTEDQWKERLTQDQYYVLREEGTEAPGSSKLNDVTEAGTFCCAGCGSPLFVTANKFDSGTGWPSFDAPITQEAVVTSTDFKLILPRTEVSCATCGGHLGHVFGDGPAATTGQRFCMNGIALTFQADQSHPDLATLVQTQQQNNPYRLALTQVLPSILTNGILGGLFFNAFVARLEQPGGLGEGPAAILAGFPLLPATYFGFQAFQACSRWSSQEQDHKEEAPSP